MPSLDPYEAPEPADPDIERLIREFVALLRASTSCPPATAGGSRSPRRLDRKQAVYVGPAGTDAERPPFARPGLGLRAGQRPRLPDPAQAERADDRRPLRDPRPPGRGVFRRHREPARRYLASVDPRRIVRRIAELADGLEDRLSRGRDLY